MSLRILLMLLCLLTLHSGRAQAPLRIGLLVPAEAGPSGLDAVLIAYAWRDDLRRRPGVAVELVVRDGGRTARDTVPGIRDLLAEGVHAILCCITPESTAAVDELDPPVVVLALARPPEAPSARNLLLLPPGPLTLARAMTADARRLGAGVALMTLDSAYGDEREDAVRAGVLEAGLSLVESARFRSGARAVTPEALLVAASQPAAVIVWAPPEDTGRALDALEARGYDGPVYLPWSTAEELPGGLRSTRLADALMVAPPILVADARTPRPAEVELTRLLSLAYSGIRPSFEAALAFDGLELLLAAAETAIVYGVDPADAAAFALALSDALLSLPARQGAAGTYDYDGRSRDLARADGLVAARVSGGRLVPVDGGLGD